MIDVLLIQPPIRDFYLTHKRTIPHGLACIAAKLEEDGYSVEILDGLARAKSRVIDLPGEMLPLRDYYRGPDRSPFSLFHEYRHYGYSLEYIGKHARASGAFLIGISSLFTAYGSVALATADLIRKVCPQAIIVMGGHHPTASPESVLDCEAVDYVLRGEGEVSLPALVQCLKSGAAVERVPGVCFRTPDGGKHLSPPAIMTDLDRYPFPALHLLRSDYYKRAAGRTAVIMTSRGCPMNCSYCSMGHQSQTPYRRRTEAGILAEIEAAVHSGVRFIDFEDEHLSLKRGPFVRILEELIKRYRGVGLELRAMNGLYPPSLDRELLELMKSAGFRALNLSLCSTSKNQLDRFGRADVSGPFSQILSWAEALELECVGYIIVGAPCQDPVSSIDDLIFLAQRKVLAGVSVYYPSPGSSDFEFCRARELLPETESLYRSSALPLTGTTSRRDSVTLLRLGRILNFMMFLDGHPEYLDGSGTSDIARGERVAEGVRLLKMFFQDGKIRGIGPEGVVFTQDASLGLSHDFIRGFKTRGNQFGRWREETWIGLGLD